MIAADQNIAAARRRVSFVPLFVTVGMGEIHFAEIVHHQHKQM